MGLTIAEGFDNWPATTSGSFFNQVGLVYIDTNVNNATVTGRNGRGKAVRLDGGNASGLRLRYLSNVSPGYITGAMGVAARQGTATGVGAAKLIQVQSLDNNQSVYVQLTGSASVIISGNFTGTANDFTVEIGFPSTSTVWNYFEMRWSATSIEVAVNNQVIYTRAVPMFEVCTIEHSLFQGAGGFYSVDLDDVYISDADEFLGDLYVRGVTLTGTDTNTGTVSGAATAHEALSTFDLDTSFVAFDAVGEKVLCSVSELAENPAQIFGVSLTRSAKKDEAGSVGEKFLIKTSTENAVGTQFTGLPVDYFGRRYVQTTNPATAGNWTKGALTTAKFGLIREV